MIQVNLLPDVKREYLKAQQMKHMFVVASMLTALTAISLLAILFAYVQVVQPRHRVNLQKDVDSSIVELKNKDNAVKIVTVQGVLEQLPGIQDKKLVTSRLFTYLSEFTPRDVSYNDVKFDSTTNIINISGQTNTLERANVLANNLKSASFTYTLNGTQATVKPFSGIVFASLGKTQQSVSGNSVSFQINFQADPVLFNQAISNQKIAVDAASEELLLPAAKPFTEKSTGAQQ